MYDTLNNIQNEQLKEDFYKKVKTYDQILEMYETDVEKFFESLRNFEQNFKLIEQL
jgi:truncated hemoglobin YjbI